MIYIFHGDNQLQSRTNYTNFLEKIPNSLITRLDSKEVTIEKVNMHLFSTSLFAEDKVLTFVNFFSITKTILDKVIEMTNITDQTIVIWQDKKLNATQLKTFPKAKITESILPKTLFICLNAIKPGNYKTLIPLLRKTLKTEPYDLMLYLIKGNLRKLLSSSSSFNQNKLRLAYISLIELDFQTKTGTLVTPKEIALERILFNLTKF